MADIKAVEAGGLGKAVRRVEDVRFLTGRGNYTDDQVLAGMVRGYVFRSPHAHARIRRIDPAEALALPGVLAVLTGADLQADGIGHMPCVVPVKRRDGSPLFVPPHPALAQDIVRYAGQGVAFVVAETAPLARDAAERIFVAYEPLDAITDMQAAAAPGAPAVWADCPDNIVFTFQQGDRAAVDAAFARAAHVTTLDFTITRVAPAPMEPRAAIASWDETTGRFTIIAGSQGPHNARRLLANAFFRMPESAFRVISPDMGGGFGMRSGIDNETVLTAWAARKLKRPVKWTGDRSEGFLADFQARDNITRAELALDKDGTFLAFRVSTLAGMGACLSFGGPGPAINNLGSLAGVYTTPAIAVEVNGVFTHTPPTAAYRGAGRPEASYAIERAIDTAARELGVDPADLRRRNTIPRITTPFQTGLVFVYDSGDFLDNLEKALAQADYTGFPVRRAASKARGKYRGFGMANVIERSAAGPEEAAEIRFDPDGSATLIVGTHSHGQGHETVFRQLLTDALGLGFDQVRFVQGDTDLVSQGAGTFGSRSSGLCGAAVQGAAEKIIDKARRIAAHRFEAAPEDVEFEGGTFRITGTDRAVSLADVAQAASDPARLPAGMEPGLADKMIYSPKAATYPNGCHCCEIEIDPATGDVEILRYIVIDDVGTVMNPMLLKGQIHGGIVQGVGQIMGEQIVWNAQTGQPLTGSFMDYAIPRADLVPSFEIESNPVPTPMNPLGIKGAGEAGTVGAMPCLVNAIVDALAPLGVTTFDMPASPQRVWQAIQGAPKKI